MSVVDERDHFLDLALRLLRPTAAEVGELTVATGWGRPVRRAVF
jgi:hypothetical protein